MANIMINEICNLRCPYCFADEYVNKQFKEITLEDFDTAIDFALSSGHDERIGIIGGEPTLHSHFKTIMSRLIDDERIRNVTLFTNGTNIEGFTDELCHPKIHLLINCNSPTNMGKNAFAKMLGNIEFLVKNKHMKDRITLGINMYKPDFDYDYIIDLLNRFGFKKVRTSVSVPNEQYFLSNPIDYFKLMKPRVLEFFVQLAHNGIVPFFDCNNIPSCVWTKEERASALSRYKGADTLTNIFNTEVKCEPVIDILPDLSCIRCFGMSEHTKKCISDFNCIADARSYYKKNVDCFACNTCHSSECKNCYEYITGKCTGGCLCFIAEKVNKLRSFADPAFCA